MSGDKEEGRNMVFDTKTQLANIAVVASETTRITQALQGWPETRWQWPTYCPGWLAADAVAHLATGGDFYAQVIAAGRQGPYQRPRTIRQRRPAVPCRERRPPRSRDVVSRLLSGP